MKKFAFLFIALIGFMTWSYFGHGIIMHPTIVGSLYSRDGEQIEKTITLSYFYKGIETKRTARTDMRGGFFFNKIKKRTFLYAFSKSSVSKIKLKVNIDGEDFILWNYNERTFSKDLDLDKNLDLDCNLDYSNPDNDNYFGLCRIGKKQK